MFHDHKHIQNSQGGGRYDAEITGDDGTGVILEKG
jgi:hypothetical protein